MSDVRPSVCNVEESLTTNHWSVNAACFQLQHWADATDIVHTISSSGQPDNVWIRVATPRTVKPWHRWRTPTGIHYSRIIVVAENHAWISWAVVFLTDGMIYHATMQCVPSANLIYRSNYKNVPAVNYPHSQTVLEDGCMDGY